MNGSLEKQKQKMSERLCPPLPSMDDPFSDGPLERKREVWKAGLRWFNVIFLPLSVDRKHYYLVNLDSELNSDLNATTQNGLLFPNSGGDQVRCAEMENGTGR